MSKLSILRPQGVSNGNTDLRIDTLVTPPTDYVTLTTLTNITAGTTIRLYLDSTYTWNII